METTLLLASPEHELSRLRREAERDALLMALITRNTMISLFAQNARIGPAAPPLLDPRMGGRKDFAH